MATTARKLLANSSFEFWEKLFIPYFFGIFPIFYLPVVVISVEFCILIKITMFFFCICLIVGYTMFGFFVIDMASERGRPCFFKLNDILENHWDSELWIVTEEWGKSCWGKPINSDCSVILLNPSEWRIR